MFLQWPDQTRQFCSRSFVAHCFVVLAFYFAQVTKAFHCLCHHFYQEMTCSTPKSNTRTTSPRQSGVFRVRLWASHFLFLREPQHYIVAFWTQTQVSLLYSFQLWIHSFIVYSYCLEQSVLSGWILRSKSVICIFTTMLKFKSFKVFNSVMPKLSQTAQEILPRIHKFL